MALREVIGGRNPEDREEDAGSETLHPLVG